METGLWKLLLHQKEIFLAQLLVNSLMGLHLLRFAKLLLSGLK